MTPSDRQDSRVHEDDPRFGTVVVDGDLHAPERARRWLAGHLDGLTAARQRDDAMLIVSELVTNAVRHGQGAVVVRAAVVDTGAIEVSVTDTGHGEPSIQPAHPIRVGGLGLRIVAELSSTWGVSRGSGGTTVWAVIAEAPS
jgi:anti-sigma regulatory factor (Ser/Thr protein kinase)